MSLNAAAGLNHDLDLSASTHLANMLAPHERPVKPSRIGALRESDLGLLQLASEGVVDKGIAMRVGLRPNQVHERWRRIREVFGAKDRSNAVAIALALGLISPPSRALQLLAEGGGLAPELA